MQGVTNEVISEVRHRANLLDVISEYVMLKRSGKDYKGLCPFHNEKTPSFFVNPEKGIFKCFGCGEGGDVFAFVQKTKRLDFLDAVRELANKTGVRLVETNVDRKEYDKRTQLLLFYQQASQYYHKLLQDPHQGAQARAYLKQRGIDEDTITSFQLGYAPGAWDDLLTFLSQANNVSPEVLVEAGLVRRKPDTNKFYDLFRQRLIIPIQDEQGRVIAFGGRTLQDDQDQIKYLNSPETAIYTKGEHLFAFHQAKESIRQQDSVIVVEGYFDAISAHLYGFKNTVATLGTALTERQGKLLVRFTEKKRVYLCFDADLAGLRATERGMETLNQIAEGIGIELRVIRLPDVKDPDECLRSLKHGPEAFAKAIKEASLLVDYQLEQAVRAIDITHFAGRIEAAKLIVPILAGLKNAVARGEYVRQWSAHLGIREEDLLADLRQFRRYQPPGTQESKLKQLPDHKPTRSGYFEAEQQILALYLNSKEDYSYLRDNLLDEKFIDPIHQRIKEAMEGIGNYLTEEDFWHHLAVRLASDAQAQPRLVEIEAKLSLLRKQKLPTTVILNEAQFRLTQEKLNQAIATLWTRLRQNKGTQEQEEICLQSKISQLKKLQDTFSQFNKNKENLEDVKKKLETLLLETMP